MDSQADAASDKAALAALYDATGGNNWSNSTNWLSEDHCSWAGIDCDENSRVTRIQLGGNNLQGSVPPELASLSELSVLNLNYNNLSGGIPLELGQLSKLSSLDLKHNNLSGLVPSSFGNLSSLTWVHLGSNNLDGALPAELGLLSNLQVMVLDFNAFTGNIPSELGNLAELTNLDLRGNQLTGSIPTSLGLLTQLTYLDLSLNDLSGTLPTELGSLTALAHLDLGGNELSGAVPSSLAQLTQLERLILTNNQLSGGLPALTGDFVSLIEISLSMNQFTGNIPVSYSAIDNLETLNVWGNNLSGPIPSELVGLQNLKRLDLSTNNFSGEIPAELGSMVSLTHLYLSQNDLTGSIPSTLGQLSQLQWLVLAFNSLTGPIPAELDQLANLKTMDLRVNTLSGNVPASLGNLAELTHLDLSANQLSGSIPTELGSLGKLTRLDFNNNSLSGSVPVSFSSLGQLTFLSLSENQLSGALPEHLGSLAALEVLSLGGNSFSGPIPEALLQLTTLRELKLYNMPLLNGPIPAAISDLTNLRVLQLFNSGFTGEIPTSLTALTNLEVLQLDGLQLTGSIPASFGSQAPLQELSLSHNNLTGSIPASLGNLNNLRILNINSNSLTGAIPGEIWSMGQLEEFLASDNSLSGGLATSIAAMSSLRVLVLQNNNLIDELPFNLASLNNLTKMSINNNKLWGVISEEMGAFISELDHYNLQHNEFACPYPSTLSNHLDTGTCLYQVVSQVSGSGGTLSYLGNVNIGEGTTRDYTLIPDSGYMPDAVGGTCPGTLTGLTYTAGPITDNCTVVATFKVLRHDVTISYGPNGSASPAGTQSVIDGTTLDITLAPNSGFEPTTPIGGTCSGLLSGNLYRAGPITEPCTIQIDFEPITHVVTPTVSGNGSVSPSTPQTIAEGNSVSFTFEPDEGHVVKAITSSCAGSRTNNVYTAGPITSDCGVTATFDTPQQIERDALESLYFAAGGQNWINDSNWLSANDHCTWYGVTCTNSRVTRLHLGVNNLSGNVPPELWELTELRELYLNNNNLSGQLPAGIAALQKLERLIIHLNPFSGSIPSELGQLSFLKQLYLSDGNFAEIPSELGLLTNLEQLHLQNNRLSGVVPNTLGNLTSLVELKLGANDLSGGIPAEFGNLSQLQLLELDGNNLSGPIPSQLGSLPNLVRLWLQQNNLSGPIPSELGQLSNLTELQLSSNQLSGSIPSQLGNLSALTELSLIDNELTGAIPAELGQLSELQFLYLWDNLLTGDIPPELGNLQNLQRFRADSNDLSGAIPPELGSLTQLVMLRLHNNKLTGEIPSELGQAPINSLYLCGNFLTGEIPPEVAGISSLSSLCLHDNQLTGEIPAALANTNAHDISLQNNLLSGEIPPALFSLPNLQILRLQNNNLSGVLPPEVTLADQLEQLEIGDNQLEGRITDEMASHIADVQVRSLSGNQFWCPYPEALAGELAGETCATVEHHLVNVSQSGGGGTASPALPRHIQNGSSITLDLAPTAGYRTVITGDCPGSQTGEDYTVGPVTADCDITFTFTRDYVVTASGGPNGTMSPSGSTPALEGETLTFNLFPNAGYMADPPTGNCNATAQGNVLSVGPVLSDCSVSVSFSEIYHYVEGVSAAGGTISPQGQQLVAETQFIEFNLTPDPGFYVAGVSSTVDTPCEGTFNQDKSVFTAGPITMGCTVRPIFSQIMLSVEASAAANGDISPSGTLSAAWGSSLSFIITPAAGYEVSPPVGGTCGGSLSGSTFTTQAITADCSVAFSFQEIAHTVNFCSGSNGGVTSSTGLSAVDGGCRAMTVADSATPTLTATAWDFHSAAQPTGTCAASCGAGSGPDKLSCQIGPVSDDCDLNFDFEVLSSGSVEPEPPTLTLSNASNNSVSVALSKNYQGSDPIQSYTVSCERNDLERVTPKGRATDGYSLGTPTIALAALQLSDGSSRNAGRVYLPTPELRSASTGETLTFNTPSGVAIVGEIQRSEVTQHGNQVVEASGDGTHITAVINPEGNFVASVDGQGGTFMSHIMEGQTVVFSDASGEMAQNPFEQDFLEQSVPNQRADYESQTLNENRSSHPEVISVGVLYDSQFAQINDEFALIDFYVDIVNQSYQDSGANVRFELVGTKLYTPPYSSITSNLNYISCGRTSCYTITSDKNPTVQAFRDSVGADIISQMQQFGSSNICGVGWITSNTNLLLNYIDAVTYNVNAVQTGYGSICPDIVMAHEIGHNLGLRHDKGTSGTDDTIFPYAYGYKVEGVFGTVMSYTSNDLYLNNVSTPNVTYQGYPIGTANEDSARAVNGVRSEFANVYVNPYVFLVTPSAGPGGSISPATAQEVEQGNRIYFTVTPDQDYDIAGVSGCGGNLVGNVFTTGPITENCQVKAVFERTSWTVTTPNQAATVGELAAGKAFACTATATNQAGASDPSAAKTFSTIPWKVTTSWTGSGSIQALGDDHPEWPPGIAVTEGGTTEFRLIPNYRYLIGEIGGTCPEGSLTGQLYSVGPVTENCSVTVNFPEQPKFSVNLASSAGGGISPSGSIVVYEGESAALTLTPSQGYGIDGVSTDCPGRLNGSTYTAGPITAQCGVTAEFYEATTCAQENYDLDSQAEVNTFAALGCNEIQGNLTIGISSNSGGDSSSLAQGDDQSDSNQTAYASWISSSDAASLGGDIENVQAIERTFSALTNVDSLAGLANLKKVRGSLRIVSNDQLTSLQGLHHLVEIDGSLEIANNDSLTNLDALAALRETSGNLEVSSNESLANVSGLSNLNFAGGSIVISFNQALTNLDGLSGSTSASSLQIVSNPNLSDLSGLAGISGSLSLLNVNGNDNLQNLDGLGSVTSISGDMNIAENDTLQTLEGLEALQSVGGELKITSNSALTDLDELVSLSQASRLTVTSNSRLASIQGLTGLQQCCDDLFVSGNTQLTNLDGLESVSAVTGTTYIQTNGLINLSGLQNLSSTGSLYLRYNFSLENCIDIAWLLGYPDGNSGGVQNTTQIYSNASGCNSIEEIFAGVKLPEAPLLAKVEPGPRQIAVTMQVVDSGTYPIERFHANCQNGTNDTTASGTSPTVMVNELIGGQTYKCSGRLESRAGIGPSSGFSIDVTLPYNYPPSGLQIRSASSGDGEISMALSLADTGGHTDITYYAQCTGGGQTKLGSSKTPNVTVSGLTNGVAYSCVAWAENPEGTAPSVALEYTLVPEEGVSGLPVWLLYIATQPE